MTPSSDHITQALIDLDRDGTGPDATQRLWDLVYPELHAIASKMMRAEDRQHTLQPTALIHEAYFRLVDQSRTEWKEKAHFLAVAARIMRRILIDHARGKSADKRGGEWQKITLQTQIRDDAGQDVFEFIALDRALDELAREDSRVARVVELRVFAGMTMKEIAEVLRFSKRTIDSDWTFALRWLAAHLERDPRAS